MKSQLSFLIMLLGFSIVAVFAQPASAHCDTYGGPVTTAARQALETGNINYVLVWVKKDAEEEVKEAFKRSLKVRKLNADAKELADKSFFETVVRLHRAGEGAPYTGLKADYDMGPAIPAADSAIRSGNVSKVQALLSIEIGKALHEHFKELMEKKQFDVNDVAKGREYVAAYVEFIHFVERIFESVHNPAHGHFEGAAEHAD